MITTKVKFSLKTKKNKKRKHSVVNSFYTFRKKGKTKTDFKNKNKTKQSPSLFWQNYPFLPKNFVPSLNYFLFFFSLHRYTDIPETRAIISLTRFHLFSCSQTAGAASLLYHSQSGELLSMEFHFSGMSFSPFFFLKTKLVLY